MRINHHRAFWILCIGALVAGVLVRLWNIGAPIADWHSWRQADTAAVARNFIKFGIDPLRPRYDDLSNIQSGKDNPMGWRMVELPVYQLKAAVLARIFPTVSVEVLLRLITVAASMGTAFLLARMFHSWLVAWVYALLPYGIFYGRTILPEPLAVFFAIASVYLLHISKGKRSRILAAAGSAALALLIKPTAGFLLVPAAYFLWRTPVAALIYGGIALAPLVWWRQWIGQFPEGIPVYEWLLNAGNIRFKGAWFWWLFAKRIGELILGFWGLILLGFGLTGRQDKEHAWMLRLMFLGSLAYLVVFAAGNVQHDYYQIILLPVISVYVARGIEVLWKINKPLVVISILFMAAFSWYTMRTYYWINRPEIVEAGRAADALLPPDAKVIAPYNGDTTFLYHTNRQGWPLGFDIDEKITMGATHYVTVSPTDADGETKDLASRYAVLVRNDKYAIIDLTKPQ